MASRYRAEQIQGSRTLNPCVVCRRVIRSLSVSWKPLFAAIGTVALPGTIEMSTLPSGCLNSSVHLHPAHDSLLVSDLPLDCRADVLDLHLVCVSMLRSLLPCL